MSALPELQAALGGALRGNEGPGLWALFREPQDVAERRFAAYRRNVTGNWRSALASTYPVLVQLLGPQRFLELADQYIVAYPSSSGDLNIYGHALAALLDASPWRDALPYLPDIARLEWALLQAYGATDAADFDLAALAGVPAETQAELRLQVWPAAALIESSWPLADIWQAHQLSTDERDAALAGIDISLFSEPRYALVARSEGSVFAVSINAGEAAFLRALQAAQSLVDAIAMALAADNNFNPGATLQRLIALHTLTGFQENKNE
jgi:hypothetical protein